MKNTEARAAQIAALNDECRRTFCAGHVFVTDGVRHLGDYNSRNALYQKIQHDVPVPGNDPYGERDFGSVTHAGTKVLWKIDCYDLNKEFHSPDPTDPSVTCRVLTIMRADEY